MEQIETHLESNWLTAFAFVIAICNKKREISKVLHIFQVTWYKAGKQISPSDKHYKISDEDCTYKLVILDCTQDDQCQYTMKCGDLSTTAKLTVEGKLHFIRHEKCISEISKNT